MKILIVDDNEENRVLQETVLKAKGYTVESAENGNHALEVAARCCPDMIISDILMPEMDGYELCRAIKADKRLRKIPFVFYSASYTGSEDKKLAMALGASRYIMKPIAMKEFVKIIDEMVKKLEDGKLKIPKKPELDDSDLERMYEKVLVNKLNEKVVELEKEITIRKEVEVRIRKLSRAVEQSPATVIITDKEGNIEYTNPKFSEITGYTSEEVIGKNPRVLKSGETLPEEYKELWKTITSGNEWRGEFHNKKKNGELYWEYASISPIRNEDGKITHFLAVKEDITKRKHAEELVKQSLEKLKMIVDGVIIALSKTIEQRDPYTAGHQQRVSKLSCAIAEEMGMPADQVDGIHTAGVLHDIGKIYIPAEILNRPGRLTDSEFTIVKSHVQVGYDILKGIKFPWPVADIVHQHHEKMDGSGYPLGLSNEDIIMEARILCVADVVEAMASHRPYRPALGMDKALEEISRGKGTIYDADVVDAYLKVVKEKKFEFEDKTL